MTRDLLGDTFRRWGYLQADLDSLGRLRPLAHADLDGASGEEAARWRSIYCGRIGVEFMHMPDPDRCAWIAQRMESEPPPPDRRLLLERIAGADLFERFLHARYVGTKRYSLEGATALIPLMDGVLEGAAGHGAQIALIGMSHRGRLTVMLQVVGVPAAHLFAGFEDTDPRSVLGSGDVKYHRGATGEYATPQGRPLHLHLVSNPSHLEAVDPVVVGRVRARQERLGDQGHRQVLPVIIHGDAAFAGQGIAAETLNLADLDGFSVGGTVHIIVNNLIGFTTEPAALHSSRYASDVAKRLPIPIFHVNSEDPEAVLRVGRMALEYRTAYASDVVVDLIGYRRYGHSEVDDPTTTQPLLYREIQARPMLWQLYAKQIAAEPADLEDMEKKIVDSLSQQQEEGRAMKKMPLLRKLPDYWEPFLGGLYQASLEVDTAVDSARLQEIARRVAAAPDGFALHPKVLKGLAQRREMGSGERPVDWGMAEALAFGSLLWDGTLVRLAGQDSRRGTFNHRHAVLFDQKTGSAYVPLRHLREGQGRFDILDTPLSEASSLGFEYGFSRDYPDALVCWEAQFGDFANGAQVILDQFISATEDKWGLLSGLVVLLPHGYEGQGPEHSSARFERFLQLAAEDNIQICYPSTAAQYFHLLRRQALRRWRKPLIVLTPKGLLRAAPACSDLRKLAEGRFQTVLPDLECPNAQRLLIGSGKIAHELRAERARRGEERTAIVALEQIYPFPEQEMQQELQRHGEAAEILWVQEEPANMGALFFVRPRLQRLAGARHVTAVRRSPSASPATGSAKAHALEQAALLELAFARLGSGGDDDATVSL